MLFLPQPLGLPSLPATEVQAPREPGKGKGRSQGHLSVTAALPTQQRGQRWGQQGMWNVLLKAITLL